MGTNAITIKVNTLPVREHLGQRVVTYEDVASVHNIKKSRLQDNFKNNRKHFIEGVDYFFLKGKDVVGNFHTTSKYTYQLNVFTETGYLMLAKSLTDDLSWAVQRELVNCYFRKSVELAKETPAKQLPMKRELQPWEFDDIANTFSDGYESYIVRKLTGDFVRVCDEADIEYMEVNGVRILSLPDLSGYICGERKRLTNRLRFLEREEMDNKLIIYQDYINTKGQVFVSLSGFLKLIHYKEEMISATKVIRHVYERKDRIPVYVGKDHEFIDNLVKQWLHLPAPKKKLKTAYDIADEIEDLGTAIDELLTLQAVDNASGFYLLKTIREKMKLLVDDAISLHTQHKAQ